MSSPDEMKAVNALRFLSIDMIEKAKSGHPGLPIDAAPMAYVLWEKMMNFNPKDPKWLNRDRFVLSAGHGSALLYSLLHFNKFSVSMDDIKQFRQLGSMTPGHPEFGHTEGIDATTGPLAQGLGMAVGMAIAERHLANVYNRPEYNIIDHYTYALVGDGDLMEGLSHEALNIAGDKKLSKLIVLYDSNDISLDGPLSLSTEEDVAGRVKAAGWDYSYVKDGNDLDAIQSAIESAKRTDQPSFIEVKTVIGYGTPLAGTNKVHGAAMGPENVEKTRENYHWDLAPFEFSKDIYDMYDNFVNLKSVAYSDWKDLFNKYSYEYPAEAGQLRANTLDTSSIKTSYKPGDEIATRVASSELLQQVADKNPQFWGGAADLSSSNKTYLKDDGDFTDENPIGRNIFFGVREFGMGAAVNGINLHGGSRAFGSTFFVFSDYMKAAIRLAAIQHLPSIFIYSHDSLAVGEDGPTHEPIEQLVGLRAIPNVNVIRPADANETEAAWKVIGETTDKPNILVTSRQKLPVLKETLAAPVAKGGYILSNSTVATPDGILIASGSEVHLALEAQNKLSELNFDVRVVSMPCIELFNRQSQEYRDSVLPPDVEHRVAIEMGTSFVWSQFTGLKGAIIGVDRFGASGKGPKVVDSYGFNTENVVNTFKKLWDKF